MPYQNCTVVGHALACPEPDRLSLRPVLGLLHGDLVDVRQRLGSAGALDGLYRDVLHLLLGLRQLFLDGRNLRLLPRHRVFERLHLQLGQPLLGLGVFLEHQQLLLKFGFGLAPRLLGGRLGLFLKPRRELFGLLAQTCQFVLALLERRFALLPALFERLLAFLVLLLGQAHIFLVLVLRLLALQRLLVFVLLDFALPLLPALFERLLAFLVLLLGQAHIFLVLVLRLLALQRLLVFVLLDFALPLLL